MVTTSAFGANYEVETQNGLTVDMANYCRGKISSNKCVYQGSVRVEIECISDRLVSRDSMIACASGSGDMIIKSSAPMLGINAGSTYRVGNSKNQFKPSDAGDGYLTLPENIYDIKIIGNNTDEAEIYKVDINIGNPTFVANSLKSASGTLRIAYKGVLRNLNNFTSNIAKSHRGHVIRFQNALKEGIKLTEEKSKDGRNKYSVVHWKIQENSRLVVAFGSILDELLTDYDDVATLKLSIKSMRTLVGQLKESYGMGRSLGGKVSKASSTLLDVVRLEIQELGSIRMAIGESVAPYAKLLKITGNLKAKVDAAKSGDMRAQREIWSFVDAWNAPEWQEQLKKMVNAGPDTKNLVTPKLSMLIQAMESLDDLSDAGFILPEL
jgi:hypothetical protein